MSGAILHTVTNVDAYARTGECRICGPVKVNRRGSASAPWRCRNQVNEYKRQRTQRLREDRRDPTELRVIAPCGATMTLPPLDEPAPADGTRVGTTSSMPCTCYRSSHLVYREHYIATDRTTIMDQVLWVEWAEYYEGGMVVARFDADGDPEFYGADDDARYSGDGVRSLGQP